MFTIHFKGRKIGALGVTYPIMVKLEAETPEQAISNLYDKYEHITVISINGDSHNPNCDGAHCKSMSGPVRILLIAGSGANSSNAILCKECYNYEMNYRRNANRDYPGKFDIPRWEDCELYYE